MPNSWEERGIAYTGNGRKEIFKKNNRIDTQPIGVPLI